MEQVRAPWGTGVFQITVDGQREPNLTQTHISRVVGQARQLRQLSWRVTVVVVSDDPAFLAAFADLSFRRGLLVWPTRLLVVTRLLLPKLRDLQETLSMTNAMLLIVDETRHSFLRCSVYIHLPYSPREEQALLVASWTPHRGLSLTTHLPLFPDKFSKFPSRPTLVVAVEVQPYHEMSVVEDPGAPGGHRLTFTGALANAVEYISRSMNFTYRYVRSVEKSFGAKQRDGSWSGMVGMVVRKEADIGLGPFATTENRAEAVDFMWPIRICKARIMAGRGRPEVDPWGFLLPLAPLVWVAILTALLLVPATMFLLSSCSSRENNSPGRGGWKVEDAFGLLRILLQQDISVAEGWWSWEQLVLGVWMMMTLVLTRSYAGNLMSLLAVRHIPHPYQTLQDVVDDLSVNMIWQTNSTSREYFRSAESGIFREVAEAETAGRVKYRRLAEYPKSVDTLVRRGDHVLIEAEAVLTMMTAQDFSQKGRCDFYTSRDGILSWLITVIAQKDSPLGPALSERIMRVTEAGLFEQWLREFIPNSTSCLQPPTKILVKTSLSVSNIWGMFAVLAAGNVLAVLFLGLEILIDRILLSENPSTRDSNTSEPVLNKE
ncbi:probable glutamate receptor [Panulirus ornatus]|uniref:probable glutamate receptor n=1 Tax=Panulirus ornatus TaxID=150431 RepID=UPI003A84E0EF